MDKTSPSQRGRYSGSCLYRDRKKVVGAGVGQRTCLVGTVSGGEEVEVPNLLPLCGTLTNG